MQKHLAHKDSVLLTVVFRGRELTHPELGEQLLARLVQSLDADGKPAGPAVLKGKVLQVLVQPSK